MECRDNGISLYSGHIYEILVLCLCLCLAPLCPSCIHNAHLLQTYISRVHYVSLFCPLSKGYAWSIACWHITLKGSCCEWFHRGHVDSSRLHRVRLNLHLHFIINKSNIYVEHDIRFIRPYAVWCCYYYEETIKRLSINKCELDGCKTNQVSWNIFWSGMIMTRAKLLSNHNKPFMMN